MDLKEYFSPKEETDHLQKETRYSSFSPWLVILEKGVYGFIRLLMALCWPFIWFFEKLADLLKHHTTFRQGDLFVSPSYVSIQSKKLKSFLHELFVKLIKNFLYLREHFEGPTFAFIHDCCVALLSVPVALFIIGNYSLNNYAFSFIVYESALFTLSTLGVFFLVGLYEAKYQPPLLPDILDHIKIVCLSIILYLPAYYLTDASADFPSSFLVILALIFFSGLLMPRLFYAMWKEQNLFFTKKTPHDRQDLKKILIIGSASETLKACMELEEDNSSYKVLGLVQEKPIFEEGTNIPIKVLGRINDLESILEDLIQHNKIPEEIWITEFHPNIKLLSHVLSISNKHAIAVKKLISLSQTASQRGGYRPLVLEDFFPSFAPTFDENILKDFVENKRFLITGAAGSLGTVLVQKIALLHPQHVVLIDHAEGNLFKLEVELTKKFPTLSYSSYLCDVVEYTLLSQIIGHESPDYIFHLAGIKQISFAETNPIQTVRTNIIGLKNVADLACQYEVKKVIFPSILQAHNPRNVLEATKRIAEGYLQHCMTREIQKASIRGKEGTQFCIVRLENILGSSGSVASLFREDLHHHKEIIITHPDMARSFISLRDAALFLLTVAAVQKELLFDPQILSEIRTHPPLKIIDLAQHLALLAGYTAGEKVKFQVKGLRPGEYLVASSEDKDRRALKETTFPGMYLCEQGLYDQTILGKILRELEEAASMGQTTHTLQLLHYLVSSFNPRSSLPLKE